MDQVVNAVLTYFSGTLGKVELFATIFSLICVYQATVHNIWTWFWGILGVVLFGYLFYEYKLYSDAGLQILFYLPMQFIGWWYWAKDAESEGVTHVATLKAKEWLFVIPVTILALVNGYVMANYTDAAFPYLDAVITWMSITAQILMTKKYLESWAFWVSMDVLAIGVYFAKGLVVTSGLYVLFLILASMGGIEWYRDWKRQKSELATA